MKSQIRQELLLLTYLIIMLGLILGKEAKGDTIGEVTRVVMNIQPKNDTLKSTKIASKIILTSKKLDLSWVTYTAMLVQESMLLDDPNGSMYSCTDCGLTQIHYPTWGEVLGLDKYRLVYDTMYSMDISYRILKRYKKQYGHEQDWYTRYHSSTPVIRERYRLAISEKVYMILQMIGGTL